MIRVARAHLIILVILGLVAGFGFGNLVATPQQSAPYTVTHACVTDVGTISTPTNP